jgi:hypothetical protein
MPAVPEDLPFTEERWVRIMADYSADGVWHRDGCGDSADELPVGADLIARIRRWQAWYEQDDPRDPDARFDVEAFAAEGRAIAQAVKAALPDWTVVYFDEAACRRGGPRETFEYEITLPPPA